MKNKNLIVIFSIIILGGACFYVGMQYQKSRVGSYSAGQFQVGVRPSGFPMRNGNSMQVGRPVSGEILSIEDNTITVKLEDGSSKLVIIADSTKVNKTLDGSREDLMVGEQIMVVGSEGTNGAVTAQNISIGGNFLRTAPLVQPTE